MDIRDDDKDKGGGIPTDIMEMIRYFNINAFKTTSYTKDSYDQMLALTCRHDAHYYLAILQLHLLSNLVLAN